MGYVDLEAYPDHFYIVIHAAPSLRDLSDADAWEIFKREWADALANAKAPFTKWHRESPLKPEAEIVRKAGGGR